jgi:hypothetical protein
MHAFHLAALAGLALAAVLMLLITQTRQPVAWPGWFLPMFVFLALASWTVVAITEAGLDALWPVYTASPWGLQAWYDRLAAVTIAFFFLQNRARAAGMKSETWVVLVIFTGSLALLAMLARMLYLERQQPG